jgi:phage-related protein
MKFQQVLSILAFTSTVYSQGTLITGVVSDIDTATQSLDSAIKGFTGGDASGLLAAQQKVKGIVNSGVDKVKGASDLTITEAAGLTSQTTGLQKDVESVVNSLISKKQALYAAGQGQVTLQSLKDQLAGAQGLAAAITSKVPDSLKSTATTLSAGIADALQKGVTAFSDAPSGGSSSGSGSSAGSSSAAAPAGSAAAKPASASSASAPSTTSAKVHPAVSTGAASSFKAPIAGVLALGALALAF